jgi:hypothetical protein
MYTRRNFKTKAELKRALASGERVEVFAPGLGSVPRDGVVYLEGPHYPKPHSWYGQGVMKDGLLEKVS